MNTRVSVIDVVDHDPEQHRQRLDFVDPETTLTHKSCSFVCVIGAFAIKLHQLRSASTDPLTTG